MGQILEGLLQIFAGLIGFVLVAVAIVLGLGVLAVMLIAAAPVVIVAVFLGALLFVFAF